MRREGAAGIIRLNRPKAINAMTFEMSIGIDKALDQFETDPAVALVLLEGAGERGLCAGGDIRGLYESSREGGDLGKRFWRQEYIMNARIARFPKPYVAFMDGLVMGGGVGLSAHGSHRVVTEKTKLAMPEVGLGFFPDVGGTWLLSHSPGEIGTYFGLTGQTMNGPDAIYAKFADAVVPSGKLAGLRETLVNLRAGANAAEVKAAIGQFATGETAGPVAAQQPQIDRWFAHDRMEDIVADLKRDGSELAQATLKALNEKSPRGMVVALKLLRLARQSSSLEECLVREYRAALEVFRSDDFREGVRAAVIDKDRNPKWSPAANRGRDAGRWSRLISRRSAPTNWCSTRQNRNTDGGNGTMANIAFIGLGNMGGPMAANLVKAGHKVTAFDLVAASRDQAKADGAGIAESAVGSVKGAEIVVTMLPAGKHVVSVWTDVVPAMTKGALIIDCSTIDVESAKQAHALAAKHGVLSVDAPVSGGTGGAKGATLTFMCGGEDKAFAAAKPVLENMGKKIVHCGGAGAGQAAKICNNMILGISMIAVGEAFALAEKLGLSHQALFDVASTSSGQCWSLTSYCPVPGPVPASPANNGYKPGFASALMVKDLTLAQDAAKAAGAATPLGKHAQEIYKAFDAAGNGGVDFSGIIQHVRGLAGK